MGLRCVGLDRKSSCPGWETTISIIG